MSHETGIFTYPSPAGRWVYRALCSCGWMGSNGYLNPDRATDDAEKHAERREQGEAA